MQGTWRQRSHKWVAVEGALYQGDWLEGMWDGWGILILDDGSKYEGFFRRSLFHGRGTLIEGEYKYVGDFVDGEFHG